MSDITRPPEIDDAITAEFPAIGDEAAPRDSVVPWLIIGALIAIVALVFFAGGLRDPNAPPAPSATTTTPVATAAIPTTTTTASTSTAPQTTPRAAPAMLEVAAIDPQGVFIEVRRRTASGPVLFSGTLAQGVAKRFAIPLDAALWLSLAWAPSARVRVGDTLQTTTGGTGTYTVTRTGLHHIATGAPTGTTSR